MREIPPGSSNPSDELSGTPETFQQTTGTPTSEHAEPTYHLPETLKSRRVLQMNPRLLGIEPRLCPKKLVTQPNKARM